MSNHDLIEYPCPICNSVSYKILFPDMLQGAAPSIGYDFSPQHNHTYRIVSCLHCQHAYASPRPRNMAENYEDHEDAIYMRYADERKITAHKLVNRLSRLLPHGRLLDVGCATGDFLIVARGVYSVEGLELSDWSAKIARQAGLTIYERTLDQMTNNGQYDIITLWGVIEHFDDPVREVRNLFRLLRPGGLVALWTGDICSWPARLLGRHWWYIQGQHIQLFSKHSLQKLFIDQGFSTAHMGLYPCVKQLHSINHSLGRYPLIGKIASKILTLPLVANNSLTLYIPGEMLAIFRKK